MGKSSNVAGPSSRGNFISRGLIAAKKMLFGKSERPVEKKSGGWFKQAWAKLTNWTSRSAGKGLSERKASFSGGDNKTEQMEVLRAIRMSELERLHSHAQDIDKEKWLTEGEQAALKKVNTNEAGLTGEEKASLKSANGKYEAVQIINEAYAKNVELEHGEIKALEKGMETGDVDNKEIWDIRDKLEKVKSQPKDLQLPWMNE